MIKIDRISKSYVMGEHLVNALVDVSLEINSGDYVAIMGPSGSGKSTLAHIIGLLDIPSTGSYLVNGNEAAHLSEDELAQLRREQVGFVFQQFNLLPRLNAAENAALPLFYSHSADISQASEVLRQVGLGDRLQHRTNELSGGQQQRVAIARALVNAPKIIIADEPTGNLDSASEKEVLAMLDQLNAQGITIIIVTHEETIGQHARRLIRMRDGKIQSDERLRPIEMTRQLDSQSDTVVKKSRQDLTPALGRPLSPFRLGSIFAEYLKLGFKTLLSNKVRTLLSMLGILIGVAAVVAMMALGRGAQVQIEKQLSSLGSNLLVLRPGNVRIGGIAQESANPKLLNYEDAKLIAQSVPGVARTAPSVSGRGQVTYLNQNWSTSVQGVSIEYPLMHNSEPATGRFFTEAENTSRTRVAVIGLTVKRQLFGESNAIGAMIKINKISFEVIGLLPEKGSNGFRDQDDIILIPVLTAMKRLFGKDNIDSMDIEVSSAALLDSTQDAIYDFLIKKKHIPLSQEDNAFTVRNMADIQQALTESSKVMSLLLSVIAAISLVVGGIGIMNIMLVTVTERTREIGLRKALGAKRSDILVQFLIESVVLTVLGGLLGILIGAGISLGLSEWAGWTTSISSTSILLAFGFATGIGLIFGIYPAMKAARLVPIVALRYE